jgi:hypothetical protein
MNAVDCPDGLARCEAGEVSASRLGTVRLPCNAPPPRCSCPWDVIGRCEYGCTAESVEILVDRTLAATQLCAPGPDAGAFARPTLPARAATPCEEGQRYACRGGLMVECASGITVGWCTHGCFSEGAAIDDDRVSREAVYAILCSR